MGGECRRTCGRVEKLLERASIPYRESVASTGTVYYRLGEQWEEEGRCWRGAPVVRLWEETVDVRVSDHACVAEAGGWEPSGGVRRPQADYTMPEVELGKGAGWEEIVSALQIAVDAALRAEEKVAPLLQGFVEKELERERRTETRRMLERARAEAEQAERWRAEGEERRAAMAEAERELAEYQRALQTGERSGWWMRSVGGNDPRTDYWHGGRCVGRIEGCEAGSRTDAELSAFVGAEIVSRHARRVRAVVERRLAKREAVQ